MQTRGESDFRHRGYPVFKRDIGDIWPNCDILGPLLEPFRSAYAMGSLGRGNKAGSTMLLTIVGPFRDFVGTKRFALYSVRHCLYTTKHTITLGITVR